MAIPSTSFAFTAFTTLTVAGALIVGVAQQKSIAENTLPVSAPDIERAASANRGQQPVDARPVPVQIRRFDVYKDPLVPPDPNDVFDITFHRDIGPSLSTALASNLYRVI